MRSAASLIRLQRLVLNFTATWGDPFYLGLTELQVLGPDLKPLPIDFSRVSAAPRDLNTLASVKDDERTLDKLFDGVTATTSDLHMWLVPFTKNGWPVCDMCDAEMLQATIC